MSDVTGPPRCYLHPDREARIRCQRCERFICPEDMREASVGFHCPSCVSAGLKTVRQPRTQAGGALSTNVGAVTLSIIGINVATHLVVLATGGVGPSIVFQEGAMWGAGVAALDQYWRLLTSAFLHAGLLHLAFNMYALYLFGPFIEHHLGRLRFIATYLSVAVASSVFVYWLTAPNIPTIGASGAVFAMFGIALIYLIRTKQNFTGMLVLLAINAVISLQANISWQGHLGGFVTGCFLGAVFAWAPRDSRDRWQIAAFVVLWIFIVVGVATRTANLMG